MSVYKNTHVGTIIPGAWLARGKSLMSMLLSIHAYKCLETLSGAWVARGKSLMSMLLSIHAYKCLETLSVAWVAGGSL